MATMQANARKRSQAIKVIGKALGITLPNVNRYHAFQREAILLDTIANALSSGGSHTSAAMGAGVEEVIALAKDNKTTKAVLIEAVLGLEPLLVPDEPPVDEDGESATGDNEDTPSDDDPNETEGEATETSNEVVEDEVTADAPVAVDGDSDEASLEDAVDGDTNN